MTKKTKAETVERLHQVGRFPFQPHIPSIGATKLDRVSGQLRALRDDFAESADAALLERIDAIIVDLAHPVPVKSEK